MISKEDLENLEALRKQLREHGAVAFCIQIVRSIDIMEAYQAASAGDKDARRFIDGLIAWDRQVSEVLEKHDQNAGCFACDAKITSHNFGGLAVASPLAESDDAVGLSAPFCDECTSKGPQQLCEALKEMIGEEFDVAFEALH